MLIEGRLTIARDHPSLAGHFPGRPIVPAALLLDAAVAAGVRGGLPALREIAIVKFTAALPPDTVVVARFDGREDGKTRLTCCGETDGTTYLTAVLDCETDAAPFGRSNMEA